MDVGKSSIAVHIPGHNLDLEIENTMASLKTFYAKLKKLYKKELKKVVWVFESTGSYSSLIYRFCAQKGIAVFMPNPQQARGFAKAIAQRNKSDRIDARVLAQSIVIAKETEIKVPVIDAMVEEFKEMIGYYRLLVKQQSQLKNHREALQAKGASKSLLDAIERQLRALNKEIEKLKATMLKTVHSDPKLSRKLDVIASIPGVGTLTALILLHLFLRYPNANQRQIVSLAGLDPVIRESGTSIRKRSKISKAGDRIYRAALFMPAMVAVRHNERLKAHYQRLKERGKHTTAAQVAVMRKILIIAHALYKTGEKYREEASPMEN
jgi:transposase